MKIRITLKSENKSYIIDEDDPPTQGLENALYQCATTRKNVFIKTGGKIFNIVYADLKIEELS